MSRRPVGVRRPGSSSRRGADAHPRTARPGGRSRSRGLGGPTASAPVTCSALRGARQPLGGTDPGEGGTLSVDVSKVVIHRQLAHEAADTGPGGKIGITWPDTPRGPHPRAWPSAAHVLVDPFPHVAVPSSSSFACAAGDEGPAAVTGLPTGWPAMNRPSRRGIRSDRATACGRAASFLSCDGRSCGRVPESTEVVVAAYPVGRPRAEGR
jgi:hypothetical protein